MIITEITVSTVTAFLLPQGDHSPEVKKRQQGYQSSEVEHGETQNPTNTLIKFRENEKLGLEPYNPKLKYNK